MLQTISMRGPNHALPASLSPPRIAGIPKRARLDHDSHFFAWGQTQNWNGGGVGKSWNTRGHVLVGFKDGKLIMARKFKATTGNLTYQLDVDRNTQGNTELVAHVSCAAHKPCVLHTSPVCGRCM